MLRRFGAISTLGNVFYWSVTNQEWVKLFNKAEALTGPDIRRVRSDFTLQEMKTGHDLYFLQEENRLSVPVIYRMRVYFYQPDRFTVDMENVSAVRFLWMKLFPPGTLKFQFFLQRQETGDWDYYSLTEIGSGASPFVQGYDRSYINRAAALFRHIAGIPTAQEPPAAP